MKPSHLTSLLMLLAALALEAAAAGVPQAINYQGYLKDSAGVPVSTQVPLTFKLYEQGEGGAPLWTETLNVTPQNGIYSVILGNSAPLDSTLLDGRNYYLAIQAGTDPEMMPRHRITSVPYAMPAGAASSVTNGVYIGGNNGAVTIGTTTNDTFTIIAGNRQVMKIEPNVNSPNIIAGHANNSVIPGVVGAVIDGGGSPFNENWVADDYGTIGGGTGNLAGDYAGTTSDRPFATVAGGTINAATGYASSVGGGYHNTADGSLSSVGGGYYNSATGQFATIPGGFTNSALGFSSFAAGSSAQANHDNTFVWSDGLTFASTATSQFLIHAYHGVGINKNDPATALDVNGTVTATDFSGSGAALTNVNAATLDGQEAAMFAAASHLHAGGDITSTVANAVNAENANNAVNAVNADTLDGIHASGFVATAGGTMTGSLNIQNPLTSGNAVEIINSDPTNLSSALVVRGNGLSSAIEALTSGTGIAGIFRVDNTENNFPALYARTYGTGPAAQFIGGSGPVAVDITGNVAATGTITAANFSGSGAGLTNLNVTSAAQLAVNPTDCPTGAFAEAIDASGNLTCSTNGASLTGLNAGNISTGLLAISIGGTGASTAPVALSNLGAVAKAGDTMTGTLNLPANGLSVGTNQLVVSGGKVGIGTATPNEQLEITGNLRLPSTGIIKAGPSPLIHTSGTDSFYAGVNAGSQTPSGFYNAASGNYALALNTGGSYNTATGNSALFNNTTGNDNTAHGHQALYSNTIGIENTASGNEALKNNTTASGNTAIGHSALYFQSYNIGGLWHTNNTAVGKYALYMNQPTAASNGTSNTALGSGAGYYNTTGYNNTFIGASSGPPEGTQLSNSTAIGYSARVSQDNSLVLGGTGGYAVNVGIGTAAPAARLTVVNSAAATKGLTVQGAASESANLQEWQNNVGTAVAWVSPAGVFNGNGSGLTGLSAVNISSGVLPITRGGTGSSTQNFVDLSTTQASISGNKTFSGTVTATELATTGNLALPTTTATTGIIKSGVSRLIHTYGLSNFFAGLNAGNLTTTGSDNSAIGDSALGSNTTGDYNTAIGSAALIVNTAGSGNTASGAYALYPNSTGSYNTANGFAALRSNTTASYNTAIGTDALNSQSYNNGGTTWNSYNTAVGYNALRSNQPTSTSNGSGNTALGVNALSSNTIGLLNTASGIGALLQNTTGSYNTANGNASLNANTTGSYNTAFGTQAGYTATPSNANTTGSNNTFIGAYSGPGTTTQLTNATAIGYKALVNQSNSLVLGGTGTDAVSVGIGTRTPAATLTVLNSIPATKGLTVQGAASQTANLQEWQDSSGAVMASVNPSGNIRSYNKDIYFRDGVDVNHGLGWYGAGKLFATTSIDGPVLYGWTGGALGTMNGGQKVMLKWDNGSFDFYGYSRFRILSSGSNSVCLDANNSISTCSSDARMKKDVVPLPETMDVLGSLLKLRGVTFAWDKSNEKAAGMADGRDLGMIAQEVEQVFPEVVHTDKDGYKSMDYPKLVAFLIEVNKAQQAQLDALNKRLTALEVR